MPFSYHAHGGDLAVPATIGSLLLDLVKKGEDMTSVEHVKARRAQSFRFFGWTDKQVMTPRFASVEKTYGAGYGAGVSLNRSRQLCCSAVLHEGSLNICDIVIS